MDATERQTKLNRLDQIRDEMASHAADEKARRITSPVEQKRILNKCLLLTSEAANLCGELIAARRAENERLGLNVVEPYRYRSVH